MSEFEGRGEKWNRYKPRVRSRLRESRERPRTLWQVSPTARRRDLAAYPSNLVGWERTFTSARARPRSRWPARQERAAGRRGWPGRPAVPMWVEWRGALPGALIGTTPNPLRGRKASGSEADRSGWAASKMSSRWTP